MWAAYPSGLLSLKAQQLVCQLCIFNAKHAALSNLYLSPHMMNFNRKKRYSDWGAGNAEYICDPGIQF